MQALREPLTVLLLVAGLVSLLIGERFDAAFIGVVVLLSVTISALQAVRADRDVRALERLLVRESRVLRDGELREVPAAEIVPGDVVSLSAGGRIPADGRLIESRGLALDESMVTGVAIPVSKRAEPPDPREAAAAERATMAYSGSVVVRGEGLIAVTATGASTRQGRASALAAQEEPEPAPFEAQLGSLAAILLRVALAVSAALAVGSFIHGTDAARALLLGIAAAVAVLPEALPGLVAFSHLRGMRHMSTRGAIVRTLDAVETLGAATVLCTGKTGVLTAAALPDLARAQEAGIRTIVMTGDDMASATAAARAVGLVVPADAVLTGPEIDALSAQELRTRLRKTTVCARASGRRKMAVVHALAADGEVVVVTGATAEDIAALRAAHAGVAIGDTATDGAIEVSDLVCVDGDIGTLVTAVEDGRSIQDNAVNALHFLLAANGGEAIVFSVPAMLGLGVPLTVPLILAINLLTDATPAFALAADPPAPDVLRRPPRRLSEHLLAPVAARLVAAALALGTAATAAFLIGEGSDEPRTMAFATLLFGQLLLALSVRGSRPFYRTWPSRALLAALGVSVAVGVAMLTISPVADRFQLTGLSGTGIAIVAGLSVLPLTVAETVKGLSSD